MTMPPVEPAQRFAANMRRLRGTRGHSQEAFALVADIHRTEVTKLESGKRDPKLGTLVKVARGLEVSLTELLDGVDGPVDPTI
jgi:transcriptional regulator with XRE-family HTH domain